MHSPSRGWLRSSTANPRPALKAEFALPQALWPEAQVKPAARLDLNAAQHNLRKAFLPAKA